MKAETVIGVVVNPKLQGRLKVRLREAEGAKMVAMKMILKTIPPQRKVVMRTILKLMAQQMVAMTTILKSTPPPGQRTVSMRKKSTLPQKKRY